MERRFGFAQAKASPNRRHVELGDLDLHKSLQMWKSRSPSATLRAARLTSPADKHLVFTRQKIKKSAPIRQRQRRRQGQSPMPSALKHILKKSDRLSLRPPHHVELGDLDLHKEPADVEVAIWLRPS